MVQWELKYNDLTDAQKSFHVGACRWGPPLYSFQGHRSIQDAPCPQDCRRKVWDRFEARRYGHWAKSQISVTGVNDIILGNCDRLLNGLRIVLSEVMFCRAYLKNESDILRVASCESPLRRNNIRFAASLQQYWTIKRRHTFYCKWDSMAASHPSHASKPTETGSFTIYFPAGRLVFFSSSSTRNRREKTLAAATRWSSRGPGCRDECSTTYVLFNGENSNRPLRTSWYYGSRCKNLSLLGASCFFTCGSAAFIVASKGKQSPFEFR